MKMVTSIISVLLLSVFLSLGAQAADGDLFVQVDNDDGDECSILQVTPDADLSQFISPAEIDALATSTDDLECNNNGLAIDMAGNVFFSIDFDPDNGGPLGDGSDILMAAPDGTLSVFVSYADLRDALNSPQIDLENGMAFGPDGSLYVNESNTNTIVRISVPGGAISSAVTESMIAALLPPNPNIDLDSGISVDQFGNVYFANDDSSNDRDNVIFKYSPVTGLSILTPQQKIVQATGEGSVDLDLGMVLHGILYVLDDGGCDCLLAVNPITGEVWEFITEEQIAGVTGEGFADPEGGIAADTFGNIYIGDDANDEPNIVLVKNGQTSLFVSDSSIEIFYSSLGIGFDPELKAGMAVQGAKERVKDIPTLSEWGLIAMAFAFGIIGLVVMRKRALRA